MPTKIPENLLNNPDRKSAFQGIKEWMSQELAPKQERVEHAISSGASAVDMALGGGYPPGKITEIVEKLPSRGAQSLIHESIRLSRKRQQFVALVDANNQFDPQSELEIHLQSLLWVRCPRTSDAIKACDILIRDGNFPLLLVDLRVRPGQLPIGVRPQAWYRIQRVSEQSQIAFVALTSSSSIPCAHHRLQLTQALELSLMDDPMASPLNRIGCESLKRRVFQEPNDNETHHLAMGQSSWG